MGTRGFIGFVTPTREVTVYNHSDSYPDYLGVNVLSWARTALDTLGHAAETAASIDAMRMVADGVDVPTPEDIERLAPWTNLGVGERVPENGAPNWYQLLRETQGDPAAILAAGCYEDASDFPQDSLFAEYGYVADLAEWRFEAYRGFQTQPHDRGRYAHRPLIVRDLRMTTYYPVALAAVWPLDALPTNEEFLKALRKADGIDED